MVTRQVRAANLHNYFFLCFFRPGRRAPTANNASASALANTCSVAAAAAAMGDSSESSSDEGDVSRRLTAGGFGRVDEKELQKRKKELQSQRKTVEDECERCEGAREAYLGQTDFFK